MNDATNTKRWLFNIGVILIVLSSIVIGVYNFGVLYLFGIPILTLILGILFVWLERRRFKAKIAVTLLPLLIIPASFFIAYQLSKAEPETFLIPSDLRGEIVVFYDEPCGQETKREAGRRIYEISNEGVLITKFKENRGFLDLKFYLVDESGNRTEIPYFHRQKFETEQREWNISRSSPVSEFTRESVGVFLAYGTETYSLSRNSLGYIISDYHYFERDEKERWLEGKHFAKTAGKLLSDCRDGQ